MYQTVDASGIEELRATATAKATVAAFAASEGQGHPRMVELEKVSVAGSGGTSMKVYILQTAVLLYCFGSIRHSSVKSCQKTLRQLSPTQNQKTQSAPDYYTALTSRLDVYNLEGGMHCNLPRPL